MFFRYIYFLWQFFIDAIAVLSMSNDEKSVEILLLRQQLRIVSRKQTRGPSIPYWQKLLLIALFLRLKRTSWASSSHSILLFKPETILKWHRELVRRKWTFDTDTRKRGRPKIDPDLEHLIVKIASENPRFGYDKIQGELAKIGYIVSATTIRTILHRHGIPPTSQRSDNWQTFLNHYKHQFFACDFFTVETLTLQTVYVLFFIEHATRRVHFAGCTSAPHSKWVTQQARQITWDLEDRDRQLRFLIRDRDRKFSHSFDAVFEFTGIQIIETPLQAPNANAFAERWVRTVREECLDRILILNESHLRSVLREYIAYYNGRRPHQGIQQSSPYGFEPPDHKQTVRRRDILGGVIKDYYRAA